MTTRNSDSLQVFACSENAADPEHCAISHAKLHRFEDQIVGVASIEKLLSYSLSLPVSMASVGMPKLEFLERNIELARAFTPMSDADRRHLTDSIAAERKVSLIKFFRDHEDS